MSDRRHSEGRLPGEGAGQEDELGRALREAYPGAPPSDEFREQMAHRLRQGGDSRAQRRRPLSSPLRFSLVLAAALLVFLGMVALRPRGVEADRLEQVEAALARVHTAHFVYWYIRDDGTRIKDREVWYRDGMWRQERGKWRSIFAGRTRWTFDPERGRWTSEPADRFFTYGDGNASPRAMVRQLAEWGVRSRLRILGIRPVEGERLLLIAVEHRNEPRRLLMGVDPTSNLPRWWAHQTRRRGQWQTTSRIDAEYNLPLPPEFFKPDAVQAPPAPRTRK